MTATAGAGRARRRFGSFPPAARSFRLPPSVMVSYLPGRTTIRCTALDGSTGALLWSFTTADAVRSSPTISAGVVYVGSNDNHLYALGRRERGAAMES